MFREIEHTSETGFIAEGATLEEVFAEAAKALFEIMTDTGRVEEQMQRTVTLEAEDIAQLMHDWLEELNYLCDTEHEFYRRFDVKIKGNRLRATIRGEPVDFDKHERRLEVKAVTYGDYYLKDLKDKWQTRVIVDV